MELIDKSKLLEGLKKLKQNLSASPIVVIEDIESLVESLETKDVNIENAYKAGFKSGLKAKAIEIPMVEWQSPCNQCGDPQMDCMNCPNHPVNRYETAYQKFLYQGNPTEENNWINQLYKEKERVDYGKDSDKH